MSAPKDSGWNFSYYQIHVGDKVRMTKGPHIGKKGKVYEWLQGIKVLVHFENEKDAVEVSAAHFELDMSKEEAHQVGQRRLMLQIGERQREIIDYQKHIDENLNEIKELMKQYEVMNKTYEEEFQHKPKSYSVDPIIPTKRKT